MAPKTDDRDIRQALADFTGGQPPVSPGRFTSVRRRVIRRRRRQLGGAVLSAVVAAAVIAGLASLPALRSAPQAPARPVPAWALDWADHRNGSVPPEVLDWAVLSWMAQEQLLTGCCNAVSFNPARPAGQVQKLAGTYPVVWYVGQTIDHGQDVVVMFEARGPGGPQLVVGLATASGVLQGRPSDDSWALTIVPAPDPRVSPAEIGEYLPGPIPVTPGQNPDNWMVVLTAPDVTRLSWMEATPTGVRRPTAAAARGLVVADDGQITSEVYLTGLTTARRFIPLGGRPLAVGVPGNGPAAPYFAAPPALHPPGSFSGIAGDQQPGSTFEEDDSFARGQHHQYAVYGICYGPSPLRITVDGHAIGSIACDSQQHELAVPASALSGRGHKLMIRYNTSDLTSWIADFGSQRQPGR